MIDIASLDIVPLSSFNVCGFVFPRNHNDADLLRFLIEQKNVTQAAVATGAGIAESTISEVLAGKRKLNRSQIGKLARYFHVEPGSFIYPQISQMGQIRSWSG